MGEDFEAVTLVDADVVFGVVENRPVRYGQGKRGRGGERLCGNVAARRIGDGFGHLGPDRARNTEHSLKAVLLIAIVDQVGIVDQPVKQVKAGKADWPQRRRGTEEENKFREREREHGQNMIGHPDRVGAGAGAEARRGIIFAAWPAFARRASAGFRQNGQRCVEIFGCEGGGRW